MKELSIEEKAKAYDEAKARISKAFNDNRCTIGFMNEIFPELKESEDEEHRKWILEYLYDGLRKSDKQFKGQFKCAIAWLEKQGKNNMGISESVKKKLEDNLSKALEKETPESWNEFLDEQKPVDKVEPKFHEGEWVIHYGTENIYQVVAVIDNQYQLKYGDNYTIQNCADVDRCTRLWDITKDAKDGDVLYSLDSNRLFIYKERNVREFMNVT